MIIDEITEENFRTKLDEGEDRVTKKIERYENQIKAVMESKTDESRKLKVPQNFQIEWEMFLDPTIWAYRFLKDKQGNPLRLRGFQDKFVNDKHRCVVCASANQIGKSVAMEVKAIHHAIHVKNASVLIISASEDQSIRVLDEIKQFLFTATVSFKELIGQIENRTELHIKNPGDKGVSIIRCLPPTKVVRGYYATLMICDEIGFWEIDGMKQTEYFNKVVMSRTLDTKNWKDKNFTMGQVCCISNPNAQQGALWALWNDPDFHQYRYCWLANKANKIEEYQKWKAKFPADEFDSVFAATFSSASGGFITEEEYSSAEREYQIQPSQVSYLGGDFAGEDTVSRDVDQTVLVGTTQVKEEKIIKVKVDYYKGFPLKTKKDEVYRTISTFKNIHKFAYDKMGVGDSVKADLKDKGILPEYKIESLTYSLPNKSEVYYNMKHLFEQRLVILPKGLLKLKEQLLGLRFEKTDAGHIKVHHASEGLHDDWADALANSLFAAKRLIGSVPSFQPLTIKKPQQLKKRQTLVCPECEKINYKDRNGYYEGFSSTGKNFERINCPMHKPVTI